MISHSFLLLEGSEPYVMYFGDAAFTLGRLAVSLFFVISGYLVFGSWERDRNAARFYRRRFRRIYPALVAMLLITAFVLGPIVTSSDHYFGQFETWSYLLRNLLLVPYQDYLPGVFNGNPVSATNGALWTLGLEAICYLFVPLIGRSRSRAALALILPAMATTLLGSYAVAREVLGDGPWTYAVTVYAQLFACFLLGAIVSSLRSFGGSRLVVSSIGASCIVALSVYLNLDMSWFVPIWLALVGITIGRLTSQRLRSALLLGDPSYGMYIYGFPLQQLVIHLSLAPASTSRFMLISLIGTILAGFASWWGVERYFLRPSYARSVTKVRARGALDVLRDDGKTGPDDQGRAAS